MKSHQELQLRQKPATICNAMLSHQPSIAAKRRIRAQHSSMLGLLASFYNSAKIVYLYVETDHRFRVNIRVVKLLE